MKKIIVLTLWPCLSFAAPQSSEKQFRAEQAVVFADPSPVCTTKEALGKYIGHLLRGEATKAKAMEINPKTGNGECFMIAKGKKVKILSVSYDNPDIPDLGVMEIVGFGNGSATGAWALTAGAVPAR